MTVLTSEPTTREVTAPPPGSRPKARPSRARRAEGRAFYGFISPWLAGTVLLTLFPLIYAFAISMTNWDGISPSFSWVGLANYADVLTDPDTWASLGRTGLLALVVVPITIVGSLLLAILLNQKVRGRTWFRVFIYLPAIVPPVAATLTWKLIFDRDTGALNAFLGFLGLDAVDWFNGDAVFGVLICVMLWGIGGGVIINLAALQDVSQELLEAATLDGANPLQRFWNVTLPSISPVMLFQTITATIGALQTFVPALLLSPAAGAAAITAVPEANQIYMIDVYAKYFAFSQYGPASAMLWLFFLAILVVTVLTFRIGGRTVFYAVDPSEEGR
ncbi:carbohydrate ABC transporter permease [Microbacterium indicum]|uniref:carbohydrate ABC transporter permease n=1 Tax=Microbacterium indicum TaxID=358100 RepID=UPI0004158FC7|nr:sugar ABC transporter permease [Microbacterium indicum]